MDFLRRILGRGPAPAPVAPLPTIEFPSSKYFPTEVVGESFYDKNIEQLCGPRTSEGENRVMPARLVLDDANPHDANAVRVEIGGLLVGHLSRETAVQYRAFLKANGHGQVVGTCSAKIKGGWRRGRNDVGNYGVTLGLHLK